MNRTERAAMAAETLAAIERGVYVRGDGRQVAIADLIQTCVDATRHYTAGDAAELRRTWLNQSTGTGAPTMEVANEPTLAGIARRLASAKAGSVGALNFASAKNPGGGFQTGAQAQEESLARASGLYPSLVSKMDFYERHRATSSALYSDALIVSPSCPVFRDDAGDWLESPRLVTFVTSAAPNAGAIASNQPNAIPEIPKVLRHRAECVLAAAAAHGVRQLVLGAWGCGVFRNSPTMVATIFGDLLRRERWGTLFDHVLFSVLDSTEEQLTLRAFQSV